VRLTGTDVFRFAARLQAQSSAHESDLEMLAHPNVDTAEHSPSIVCVRALKCQTAMLREWWT
jgi:hypothetical protein